MKKQIVKRLVLFFAVLLVVGLTIGYNLYTNYRMITRQEEQRLMT